MSDADERVRAIRGFQPGDRVRLAWLPPNWELSEPTGEVVGRDPSPYFDGYYVVRLDRPARYRETEGRWVELPEIREYGPNLVPLGS